MARLMAPRPQSKAEQLASHFQSLIEAGYLAEGQHLGTKADLVGQHQVASGTINEALRLLQARGYVVLRSGPKGGAFVAERGRRVRLRHSLLDVAGSPDELENAITVRDALEVIVATEAATACSDEEAKRIQALMEHVEAAADTGELLTRIWALHRGIASAGRNKVLSAIYNGLLDSIESLVIGYSMGDTVPSGVSDDTIKVHRELVEAVIAHDVQRAAEAALLHTPIGHPGQLGEAMKSRH